MGEALYIYKVRRRNRTMPKTLLVCSPQFTWREWLKQHLGVRPLLVLDPSDATYGPPARLALYREGKLEAWEFYGSLDPQRFPHVLLAGLARLLAAGEDVVVLLFPYRASPLLRHLVLMIAQIVQPDEVFVGGQVELSGWPVGPEEIELEAAFPAMVQSAQRKAHWIKLLEDCEEHEVELRKTPLLGARLGSGRVLSREELDRAGVGAAAYGEVCGSALLLLDTDGVEEDAVRRALDFFHCTRAHLVESSLLEGLVCSFARQSGEDFGMGFVKCLDVRAMAARVLCTAVAPAPVRLLKLGSLRVDHQGREVAELKPWQA
jgi:polynucleotide 5'-kinase involved in rRNA processing